MSSGVVRAVCTHQAHKSHQIVSLRKTKQRSSDQSRTDRANQWQVILAFQNGFIAGLRELCPSIWVPLANTELDPGIAWLNGKEWALFRDPAGPVSQGLVKTAHLVCPATNAFLVPTMNFLAKIFAV